MEEAELFGIGNILYVISKENDIRG